MCGIVGFAGREPIGSESLLAMRDTMAHRGPDDLGLWMASDGSAGLAQRRLAVVDLSPGGHQPMTDASGRIHVSFNGEIYNFRDVRKDLESRGFSFRSESDTEVILAAWREWGESFLEHLEGMFSIALYDSGERALYLARDRAGEKPLFLWQTPARLAFASELKALFAFHEFPRRLSIRALEHYLAVGYVPRDLCMVDGVRKLLPGRALRYDGTTGSIREWQYWDLPAPDPRARDASIDDLSDELHRLLRASVGRQLLADVPVGVLLSGGVDSSLITAVAAGLSSKPVKTFTISFPGHAAEDESAYARIVASHFGTEHIELPAEEGSLDMVDQLVRQFDEPIADSSAIPTFLVSRLVRRHATVALGGDGGDELFGGYPWYRWIAHLERVKSALPGPILRLVGRTAKSLPVGTRGRNYGVAIAHSGFDALGRTNLYFDEEWRRSLMVRQSVSGSPEALRVELTRGAQSILQAMQRIDFRSYMVDNVLVKVDRASMLASLETRAPFLDPGVIAFAFARVPDRMKATGRSTKILLRHLAGRLLPSDLGQRAKQGFSVPLERWFEGSWGNRMSEVLMNADPTIFSKRAIGELFEMQKRHSNQAARLYALMMFELWRREFRIET